MSLFEDMPFPRGQTFYNLTAAGAAKTNIGAAGQTDRMFEGRDYWHPDVVLGTGAAQGTYVPRNTTQVTADSGSPGGNVSYSNRYVKVRLVRWEGSDNTAIVNQTVGAGKLCLIDWTTDGYAQRISGLSSAVRQFAVPADEMLGLSIYKWDLFYVVTKGPANIVSDGSSTAFTVSNAATAFVGTSATAGSCVAVDYSGATTTLAQAILTTIGRTLPMTTAQLANASALAIPVDVGGTAIGM